MSRQAKVGAMFLLFFGLLLYLSPTLSQRSEVLGNTYDLVFEKANGLREGDGVKMAGTSVGQITGIDFASPEIQRRFGAGGRVVVRIVTDFGVLIPEDSQASIETTLGGLRWVELTPGHSEQLLKPGSLSRLREVPSQQNQLEASMNGLKELNQRTREVRADIEDPQFRRDMKDLASNSRFYSTEFRSVSQGAQGQVAAARRALDARQEALLRQLGRIDVQVEQARLRMKKMVPQVNEQLTAWQARIDRAEGEIQGMTETAVRETERFRELAKAAEDRLASGPTDQEIRQKIESLATKTEEIANLADDLHQVTSSPETQAELRAMVEKYRRQAEEMRRNLERWDKAIP